MLDSIEGGFKHKKEVWDIVTDIRYVSRARPCCSSDNGVVADNPA